jgi:GT2 family glycosyltransferase
VHWVPGIRPFVFSRNINLGIREAGTDVVLLNDDARLLTPRGLTHLANEVTRHPALGLCSPGILGVVGNPNQLATGRSELRVEQTMLAFVCIYIPRSTYQHVGPLDERFTGYGFDDNDYCARVLAAGLRLAVWDGCIVDHSGEIGSTFRTRPDIGALFALNQRRFRDKWGRDL